LRFLSIYEVSPDFGMMSQAWNVYSYAYPIVQQFFGVQPFVYNKSIRIQPQMPSSWNEASLENVMVGDNELDYTFKRTGKRMELHLTQLQKSWKLTIALPKGTSKKWEINGKAVKPVAQGAFDTFEITGKANAFSAEMN
jgi:hypothetical protein